MILCYALLSRGLVLTCVIGAQIIDTALLSTHNLRFVRKIGKKRKIGLGANCSQRLMEDKELIKTHLITSKTGKIPLNPNWGKINFIIMFC